MDTSSTLGAFLRDNLPNIVCYNSYWTLVMYLLFRKHMETLHTCMNCKNAFLSMLCTAPSANIGGWVG